MRKTTFVLMILLVGCIAVLCSCAPASSTPSPDTDNSRTPVSANQSDIAPVTVQDIISTETPPQFAGMEVIESTGIVDWGIYPFPENVASLSDAVVYGTVTDKQYVNFSGNAWTEMDFSVEQTLLGDVSAVSTLTIYSSGGYITQYDLFTAQEMRERATERTDKQLQNTIVHEHADYHFDPLVGKKYILFLAQPNPDSSLPQDVYQIVGEKFCQLCETAPDTFSYIAFGPNPEDPDAAFSPDDPVVQITRDEVEALLAETQS